MCIGVIYIFSLKPVINLEGIIYFTHFRLGDKGMIIDDVVSSGSTIRTFFEQLKALQVVIVGIQVILVKGNYYKKISNQNGAPINYLVSER